MGFLETPSSFQDQFQTQAIEGCLHSLHSLDYSIHTPDCRKNSDCGLCEIIKQMLLTSIGLLLGVSMQSWQKIRPRMSSF